MAGEAWGFKYYLDPKSDVDEQQPPPLLPEPSEGVEFLDPEQAVAKLDLPQTGAGSTISMMECGAYSCYFTNQERPVVERLLDAYPDIAFHWLHAPTNPDKRSLLMHRAAVAAQNQGKFWQLHDALFDKSSVSDVAGILEIARAAGLDLERFEADLDAPATVQTIADQRAWCRAYGMRGTPSFLVDGRLMTGARKYEDLVEVVEEALADAAE